MKNYKVIREYNFELSDEEFAFLKKIKQETFAEFRDFEYDSYEDYNESWKKYRKNDPEISMMTEQRFNARNFDDTSVVASRLHEVGLIDINEDSWHTTFHISELGELLLEQND